ncbi:unnamed protein product [Adineta steineri]|uniref:Uncharacterized protein n=1 Tax=Adineta steineri TaxID=433720 RepID=A0A818KJ05_9BILA|nr:unnamed protein product [Adineta steineri]CAF3557135.1 unnamed protein product [Adineta steineri]
MDTDVALVTSSHPHPQDTVSNIPTDNIERDYDLVISYVKFESSNHPFENEISDQYVVINNSSTEDNIEAYDDMDHFISEKYLHQISFALDNISSDFTSVQVQQLLLKFINFIYDAKLNKTTNAL